MDQKTSYLKQIRALAPDLFYQDAFLDQSGQFNDVLILDAEWIFRFPRYAEGVQRLAHETGLLLALQGRLPLPVPNPLYRRFDPPLPGQAFMGYPRLPGEPLSKTRLAAIRDRAVREHLAGQLAAFLRALHSLPVDSLGLPIEETDAPAGWARMYAEIHEKLFPAMRPDARAQVARHFESYLGSTILQQFQPVLRHGDFGGSNILFDPRRQTITGVIDFGFCALGDPSADLASVSTLGMPFLALILQNYEPEETSREDLLARIQFYRGTFALSEALDGYNHHDRRAYLAGMENYI